MRIYTNPSAAFNETVRDVSEMGIDVRPQTMQDKTVTNNPDYATREVMGYGFTINEWLWSPTGESDATQMFFPEVQEHARVLAFIQQEYEDRLSLDPTANPGNAWKCRPDVWDEFIHPSQVLRDESGPDEEPNLSIGPGFHYTYAERFAVQIPRVLDRLQVDPHTRQAIITMHSNINTHASGVSGDDRVEASQDYEYMGGIGRIPCSMFYQFLVRDNKVHLVYSMRSCDLFTHFPIDVMMSLRLQSWMADRLSLDVGRMTYFASSLHAYQKDIDRTHLF